MKLSKKDCNGSCKFKCSNKYSEIDKKCFGVIVMQKIMLSMAKTLRENEKVEHVQKTLNLGELFFI